MNSSKHILIFFILLGATLLLLDRFVFQSSDMQLLKQQRVENFKTLSKDKPVEIGVAWTFPPYALKDDLKNGILLAVKKLNDKILGRKIKIIFKNDKAKKSVAVNIADDFANNKNIVAVIAHNNVSIAIPASVIYEYSGIIMLSPAISSPDFTRRSFDYIFRNTPGDTNIGQQIANFATLMNFRKIIILNSRDRHSEALTKGFRRKAITDGLKIIYSNDFNIKERNFAEIMSSISPKINHTIDYDAIFVAGNINSISALIEKARQYGIFAPFITGNILNGVGILKMKKNMNNTIVATVYNEELIYKKTQDFINNFKKEYGHVPDTWGAQGYDAMMLLAKAIEKADSLDGSLISEQLKYMKDYDSIFGKYSLNTKGDVVGRKISFKVVKNGKFHYLHKVLK